MPEDVRRCECGADLHLLESPCEACGMAYEWSFIAACPECGRETDYLDGPCDCGVDLSPWRVAEQVASDAGSVTIAKGALERPMAAGYKRHLGTVRGQWADYRRETDEGEFHVRVYLDHYELHVDEVGALEDPTGHTLRYGPAAAVTTSTDAVRGARGLAGRAGRLLRAAARVPASLLPDTDDR